MGVPKGWVVFGALAVVAGCVAALAVTHRARSRVTAAVAASPKMAAIQRMVEQGHLSQAVAKLKADYRFDNPHGIAALREFSLIVLRQGLKEHNIFEQCFAATALAEHGDYQGLKLLVDTFNKNPDLSVKMAVADGLGQDGNKRAVDVLSYLYQHTKPFNRRIIVDGLSEATAPSAVTLLSEATHDKDRMVRLQALKSLGVLGNRSAIPLLQSVVASSKRGRFERVMAARSLLLLGDKSGLPFLRNTLFEHSNDSEARAVAAASLGFANDPVAVPLLKQALTDQKIEVRIGAAVALTHYADPTGVQYLKNTLAGSDDMTRLEISQAFGDLDTKGGRAVMLAGLNSRYANVRLAAIKELGRAGGERNLALLIGFLRTTNDSSERAEVAWALGRIGSPGGIDTLLTMIPAQETSVRYTAADSLSRIATHMLDSGDRWKI